MDCRPQARKRGLVILGTRKILDFSIAAIGMLWAKRQGKRQFRAYHDLVFERFWRRELDIEDLEVIAAVISEVHADRTGFRSYLAGAGPIEHDTVREFAETAGVFGVPSFIVEGKLFWGSEHLADIREKLATSARKTPPARPEKATDQRDHSEPELRGRSCAITVQALFAITRKG